MALTTALKHSDTLGGLLQRVRLSTARLAALQPLLPPPLWAAVRAGPLDDEAWLLLVDNAAVAAKLRQLLPALQAELLQHGYAKPPLRIKVLPRT